MNSNKKPYLSCIDYTVSNKKHYLSCIDYTVSNKKFDLIYNAKLDMLKTWRLAHLMNLMYKCRFLYGAINPNLTTRAGQAIKFPIDKPNLKVYEKSPYVIGSEIWLTLPTNIKNSETLLDFKNKTLKWLQDNSDNIV